MVAVMFAIPATPPVTVTLSPVPETVATEGLSDSQEIARPGSMRPLASFAAAETVVDAFWTIDVAVAEISTLATGTGVTVMVAVPVFPSAVASAVAVPGASPVISPVLLSMEANAPPEVILQVTLRSVTVCPRVSLTVADSVTV